MSRLRDEGGFFVHCNIFAVVHTRDILRRQSRILIPIGIVCLSLLFHLRFMNQPPRGVHVWRQCNTLAVAKNFHEESMNIFQPRVDHRKGTNGVTGTAFPLYEYLLALVYQVVGFHETSHRWLQFLIYAFLIFGVYRFSERWFNHAVVPAAIGTWLVAWSPDIYYHAINALPDVLALCLSVWGLERYLRYKAKPQTTILMASMVLLALGGMVKLQFLMFSGLVIIDQFRGRWMFPNSIQRAAMLSFVPAAIWYTYASWLRETSGLKDIGLRLNPLRSVHDFLELFQSNLISDFPELLIGYGGLILVLLGAFYLVKSTTQQTRAKIGIAFLGLLIYHVLESGQFKFHAYYMMPYVLFFGVLAGYGARYAMDRTQSRRMWIIPFLLIAVQPIITSARIDHRYTDDHRSELPQEFLQPEQLDSLRDLVGNSHRVLVAPDPSGCVYFYHLQCKGWSFAKMDDVPDQTEWDELGIRPEWVVLQSSDNLETDSAHHQIGSFIIRKME